MSEEATNTGSVEAVPTSAEAPDTSSLMSTESSAVESATSEASAEFNFRDHLSDEYKDDSSIKDFKDLDGLIKSYKNAQSMIGGSIRIPGEEASADERAEFFEKIKDVPGVGKMPDPTNEAEIRAFYQKLGCPENPEGYELELPEGASVAGFEEFIEAAHSAGLTSSQLQVLAEVNLQREMAKAESFQSSREAAKATLQEVFGDNFENKLASAKQAAAMYAERAPEAVQELLNSEAGNNPALVMMLADLGSSLKEDSHKGTESAPSHGMSLNDVSDKISKLYKDDKFMHAWSHPTDPGHNAAKAKMDDLYGIQHQLRQGR